MSRKWSSNLGRIVEIRGATGRYYYGIIVTDSWIAFYDVESPHPLSLPDLIATSVLFLARVQPYAKGGKRWTLGGVLPLPRATRRGLKTHARALRTPPRTSRGSRVGEDRLILLKTEIDSEKEWDAEAIENRLAAHFERRRAPQLFLLPVAV